MERVLNILLIFIATLTFANAQTNNAVYFEKAPHDMVRFFYNSDYFLVDKNCEFKFLERVGGFNTASNKFNGEFKDFNLNGRLLLSGNYVEGKKEGKFSAYYPNGEQKWHITFKNNVPVDSAMYFYPDGKPLLQIYIHNQNVYITQYWNKLGQQKVKDGEGYLDITLPIIGFTEHGFTKYTTKGKVKDGLQQGLWYTSFVQDDKKRQETLLMVSAYDNGVLTNRETEEFFDNVLIDINSFTFIPQDLFYNAELLQSKNCTFDEYTGFNNYIAEKFTHFLKYTKFPNLYNGNTSLTYNIRISKKGVPYAPTLVESSRELSQKEKIFFTQMINQIPYYLPSYKEGKPIDDLLTISLIIDTNGDKNDIPPVQIKREKGF